MTNIINQPNRIIVVLGMDRSGTSLCTNILNCLGVDLSEQLYPPMPENPKGFFESSRIVSLHNSLLKLLDSGWGMSTTIKPYPVVWWRLPQIQQIRKELTDFLRQECQTRGALWGFKDPRTARLLPLWKDIFNELNIIPCYVLCVRNPHAVAQSLQKRNQFNLKYAELLWLEHNLQALSYGADKIAAIVHYEDWFIKPVQTAQQLIQQLTLPWNGDDIDLKAMLQQVITPEYRHDINISNTNFFQIGFTEELYNALCLNSIEQLLNTAKLGRQILAISQDISDYVSQDNQQTKEKLEEIIKNKNGLIAERDNQIKQLQQNIASKDTSITEVESAKTLLNQQITEQNQKISTINQEIMAKETRLTELQSVISTLNEQMTQKDQKIEQLILDMSNKEKKILEIEANTTALNNKIKEYEQHNQLIKNPSS